MVPAMEGDKAKITTSAPMPPAWTDELIQFEPTLTEAACSIVKEKTKDWTADQKKQTGH